MLLSILLGHRLRCASTVEQDLCAQTDAVQRGELLGCIGDQSIYAQTITPFVFQEGTVTRAPSPNHNSVHVSRAYGDQSIHARTMIAFMFQKHTVTSASMLKPYKGSCSKRIRSPEHPCPNHNNVHVPRAYGGPEHPCPTIISFVFQELTVTRASMP